MSLPPFYQPGEKDLSADSLPGGAFQADAIRQSHARKLAKSVSSVRLITLLVPRIGSSSRPQAGVEIDALHRLALLKA